MSPAVPGRADHRDVEGAGGRSGDGRRKHGVSSATFYRFKTKFGGRDVSEARRLRSLEDETSKLKRTLADAMLDTVALKDLLERSGDARRRAEGRWCLTR